MCALKMRKTLFLWAAPMLFMSVHAQHKDAEVEKIDLTEGLKYNIELQGSFSNEKTPLWLNANKYGLSSLDKTNGYVRTAVGRPLETDADRKWGIGYGVDIAVPVNYTSNVILQQAFVEARWLKGVLSVGSKEQPLNMKSQLLSSGSLALGKNARPVPEVRLALPEYWRLPFGNGWFHLRGHIAYGKMTDQNWQHDFTGKISRYADGVMYHSKSGFLMFGNQDSFFPFSVELGLEMAAQYGGTSYLPQGDGTMRELQGKGGLRGMWDAFLPGGSEADETAYKNVSGNQLGSWMMRLNWDEDMWRFSVYADKFFEDHSGMFNLDYDGYGTGDEWDVRKKHRYLFYDLKDWMLGAELYFKYDRWINNVVFEYIYTKYQSGPIYHDHTPSMPDHIGGMDNFYNHHVYTGWQHWGQVMGNPLFRSPIYNEDGEIIVKNNRFTAFHLGISGHPNDQFNYRALATYQEGLGTYALPYTKRRHNVSFMLEGTYNFTVKSLRGFSVTGAYAMDFGSIFGHNAGFQLTLARTGLFKK